MPCLAADQYAPTQRKPGKAEPFLGNTPLRPPPSAPARPKTGPGLAMHCAAAIARRIAGIFSLGRIDRFMGIAPGVPLVVNGVFIGKNARAGLAGWTDKRRAGRALDLGQPSHNPGAAALDHA